MPKKSPSKSAAPKKAAVKKITKEQAKLLGAGNQPAKGGGVVASVGVRGALKK